MYELIIILTSHLKNNLMRKTNKAVLANSLTKIQNKKIQNHVQWMGEVLQIFPWRSGDLVILEKLLTIYYAKTRFMLNNIIAADGYGKWGFH